VNRTWIKGALTILSILWRLSGYSQELINGQLLNADSKPIPYANIGIVKSSVGTLSNGDGTFSVSIPLRHLDDTLVFSSLGYQRLSIPIQSLLNKPHVRIPLVENVTVLAEVIVSDKKQKQKSFSLGNRYTQGGFLYADSLSAGAAMALLIENKYPSYHDELTAPYFVRDGKIFINKNTLDTFRLRIRFMDVDTVTGQPSKDLCDKDIIVSSSISKGWLDVDFKKYGIITDKKFFLVVEWIMNDQDRLNLLNDYAVFRREHPEKVKADSTVVDGQKVGFWSYYDFKPGTHLGVSPIPFSLEHYTCYYRTNSFGEWKRSPVVLTARVDVVSLAR
jgi:hypothetical protein